MTKSIFCALTLALCLFSTTGCGGGSTEPEFKESDVQSETEQEAADDYMKQMQNQQKEQYGS